MIKVQILLRRDMRTPEGIKTVKRMLASLGMKPSASGAASISAVVEEKRFSAIFGSGAPEAHEAAGMQAAPLSVPDILKEYVAGVSVAPSPRCVGAAPLHLGRCVGYHRAARCRPTLSRTSRVRPPFAVRSRPPRWWAQ